MGRLILVRHAAPEVTPDVPSDRWVLSAAGRQTCRWLAQELHAQGVQHLHASLQPKALETAALAAVDLGLDVRPRRDLGENDRTGLGFAPAGEMERTLRRFFDEPDMLVMGRETARAAHARFDAALRAIAAESAEATVAVVAHGVVITLLLASRLGVESFSLWKRLSLPCWAALDGPDLRWDGALHAPPRLGSEIIATAQRSFTAALKNLQFAGFPAIIMCNSQPAPGRPIRQRKALRAPY